MNLVKVCKPVLVLLVWHFILGSNEWCNHEKCQANISTVITIPCGEYPENDNVMFTYSNDSSDGEVLSANTTLYYRLNVTAFDDNTRIICRSNITNSGVYIYDLSITCKWSQQA